MTLFGLVVGPLLLIWWIGVLTKNEKPGPYRGIMNRWEK